MTCRAALVAAPVRAIRRSRPLHRPARRLAARSARRLSNRARRRGARRPGHRADAGAGARLCVQPDQHLLVPRPRRRPARGDRRGAQHLRRPARLSAAARGAPRSVTKKLYVSPFNPVAGYYLVRAPRPDEKLDVVISLHRRISRPSSPHCAAPGDRRPSDMSHGCSSSHRWRR